MAFVLLIRQEGARYHDILPDNSGGSAALSGRIAHWSRTRLCAVDAVRDIPGHECVVAQQAISRTLTELRSPMHRKKAGQIMKRLQSVIPEPKTELVFDTEFELLVAVMLSAQATDMSVNRATRELFRTANTPQAIIALGVEGLRPYLKTINYHPTKARNLISASQILVGNFGGRVPQTREELLTLPGVGRKTANVILNTAFGQPTIAVDTHVFRVANRTGIAKGKNVNEVEKALLDIIPDSLVRNAHHWLILHGRHTCMARKPKCDICPISDLCEHTQKHLT